MARERRLKPAGHSAFVEGLITPMIVVGSSLLSTVAAYVLGEDFIKALLTNQGNAFDIFMVVLCGGLGFMVDTALIVAATRYKMHALRGATDQKWKRLSQAVLLLCLTVETMTLCYFFYLIAPGTVPGWMVAILQEVHNALFFVRGFTPPLIIVYFVAGVLPVVIERSDRDRDLKSKTSQDISILVGRLTDLRDVTEPGEMIRLLASQLELNAYADGSDEGAMTRDRQLVDRLAALHGLDLLTLPALPAPPRVEAPPGVPDEGDRHPVPLGRMRRPQPEALDDVVRALGGAS